MRNFQGEKYQKQVNRSRITNKLLCNWVHVCKSYQWPHRVLHMKWDVQEIIKTILSMNHNQTILTSCRCNTGRDLKTKTRNNSRWWLSFGWEKGEQYDIFRLLKSTPRIRAYININGNLFYGRHLLAWQSRFQFLNSLSRSSLKICFPLVNNHVTIFCCSLITAGKRSSTYSLCTHQSFPSFLPYRKSLLPPPISSCIEHCNQTYNQLKALEAILTAD